jgi:hypothetical protein
MVLRTLILLASLLVAGPALAAGPCVSLFTDADGDVLRNRCGLCMEVGVERRRPGGGGASLRTFVLGPSSDQPLGFRGPGQTRLTSERPCTPGRSQPAAGP